MKFEMSKEELKIVCDGLVGYVREETRKAEKQVEQRPQPWTVEEIVRLIREAKEIDPEINIPQTLSALVDLRKRWP